MHIRLFFIMMLAIFVSLGCGNDDDDPKAEAPMAGLPESICPADSGLSTAAVFQPLDHDGGHSDLRLEWDVYQQQGYACSGEYDFTLRATNTAEHSDAHRVWFTILFYHGNEYIEDLSIYPQGITIPVGETQDFNFQLDIHDSFASAPDDRDITAAIIIQTDNPNWSDPDAFFTRTWIRLVPASDCDAEPMEQPDKHMISIHSVTCKDNTVVLQTHASMMDGFPQSEVISGPILLNGGVYEKDGFFYQSTHIADNIPDGTRAEVDMFSNSEDRIRFYFTERVDCAWSTTPLHPPVDDDDDADGNGEGDGNHDDGEGDDNGDGDGNHDDGEGDVTAPDPDDPDKPDETVAPKPEKTVEEDFVQVDACGARLEGSVVPPEADGVTGDTWKEIAPDGSTTLFFDLQHLPEASIGEGQNGWVQGVQSGQFVAWLVRKDDAETHMVPVQAFTSEQDGSTRLSVALDKDAVVGLEQSLGKWVDADGASREATQAAPLSSFRGFVITLQPDSDILSPNGMVMGGGWLP